MFQPNSDCAQFCYWMLNYSSQRLSGTQRSIVETVYNAAISVTPVSNNVWSNFNLFTPWRYPYYLVFRDNATFVDNGLLSGCIFSANFEGNADNLVNGEVATNQNVIFGNSYGKVLQGAFFNGSNARLLYNNYAISSAFSVNVWIKPDVSGNQYSAICQFFPGGGIQLDRLASVVQIFLNNSSYLIPQVITFGVYTMVTYTFSGSVLKVYINGSLAASVSHSTVPFVFLAIGQFNSAYWYQGSLDMFSLWNYELNQSQVSSLFNSSAGLQYPFS